MDDTGKNDTPIPQNKLHGMFQELCIYDVPTALRLPIRVYEEECFDGPKAWLPYVKRVADKLSLINQSVFLTGWELKHTTVTSNMVTGKVIESEWTSVLDGLRKDGKLEKFLEDGERTLGPDCEFLSPQSAYFLCTHNSDSSESIRCGDGKKFSWKRAERKIRRERNFKYRKRRGCIGVKFDWLIPSTWV